MAIGYWLLPVTNEWGSVCINDTLLPSTTPFNQKRKTHTHPPTHTIGEAFSLMLADNFIRCEKWTRLKIGRRGYVNLTLYIKMLHLIIQNNYTIKEYLNLLDAALCVDV